MMTTASVPPDFSPRADLLAGRSILITGASGGLGRALSLACAQAGASVIVSGRNATRLRKLYDDIEAAGGPRPALLPLDLATATAAEYDALADAVDAEFGKLDGIVHCAAALGDRTPLEQYDVPTWCRVLHVNLTAPFILTQVLLPSLRRSEDASVIFVSSGIVHKPRPFWGAYAVSKTGLEAVRTLYSEELASITNVRLNTVNPGRMRTAMRASAYPGEDPNTLPGPAAVVAPFLYLLSAAGREVRNGYFEAQPAA
jgi:NAD(P)-dependent dehydrogenase (short-subunit alcohol dehydrogenase family)